MSNNKQYELRSRGDQRDGGVNGNSINLNGNETGAADDMTANNENILLQIKLLEAQAAERERAFMREQKEAERVEKEREHERALELLEARRQLSEVRSIAGSIHGSTENLSREIGSNERVNSREINGQLDFKRITHWHSMLSAIVPDCGNAHTDLNVFFKVVEGLFATHLIPKEYHATLVTPLLKSRGTSLLTTLSTDELRDYEKIKATCLQQNHTTPIELRRRFVSARRKDDETYTRFATRLQSLLYYYLESRKAETAEEIKMVILADQFKDTLDSETRAYVELQVGKMTSPSVRELAELADLHRNAMNSSRKSDTTKGSSNTRFGGGSSNSHVHVDRTKVNSNNGKEKTDRSGEEQNTRPSFKLRCFRCRGNHLYRDCPKRKPRETPVNHVAAESSSTTGNDVLANASSEGTFTARVSISGFKEKEVTNKADVLALGETKYSLQRVGVITNKGATIEAIIDSGCELSVVHSDCVDTDKVVKRGKVLLKPAIGPGHLADLVEMPLSLRSKDGTNHDAIRPEVTIWAAVTPNLNTDLLLTPKDYEELKCQADYYISDNVKAVSQTENLIAYNEDCIIELQSGSDMVDELTEASPLDLDKLFCPEPDFNKVVSIGLLNESEDLENNHVPEVNESSEAAKLKAEQHGCTTLAKAWACLRAKKGKYKSIDGLLYHEDKIQGNVVMQLVLPKSRRYDVMKMAHEGVCGGHLGARKTAERIRYSFYWEGLRKDVNDYCSQCGPCQKRQTVRIGDRIPIEAVARPALPFQIINVDVIGPIEPASHGKRYVLTIVDQHTRWVEAIALSNLSAQTTCDALLQVFMRFGLPQVIATDCGSNFTSALTQDFEKLLGVSPRFSTPGHAAANGLVERYNRVLKQMMHHVIQVHPGNWDRHLPFLTWAYNEVASATTGYSPFRLMFGREPTGPLAILKRTWDGSILAPNNETEPAHVYLQNLKAKMEEAAERAGIISQEQQRKYVGYYNLRSRVHEYSEGDQVVVLIPDSTNKLLAKWTGPATVLKRYKPHSYLVELPNGSRRHLHVDKLRRYLVSNTSTVAVVYDEDEPMGHISPAPMLADEPLGIIDPMARGKLTEHLDADRANDLQGLLAEFPNLFSGVLRRITVGKHTIRLKQGAEFKAPHIYRVPEILKDEVDNQIKELLQRGLIVPSESEFVHPIVCVRKKDSSVRLCVDYRSLNSISEPDRFPMEQAVDLLYDIGRAKFVTVLDMQKAYWQVSLDPDCRHYTTFVTHRGMYAWNVMPFGLKGAPATFQRIINHVLSPHRSYARSYIDDVAVFSSSWDEHIEHLHDVFQTLDAHKFSVNLGKSLLARPEVKYLGHIVGSGHHRPDPEKLAAIQGICRPTTKRDLRGFLGLCNYYRDYIQNFASLAIPLTELTKKKVPTTIPWPEKAQNSFEALKQALYHAPSLYTPDMSRSFFLECDASDYAIGSCLAQEGDQGERRPIAFASHKLTPAQQKWSTSEREAYAIIFSLNKFEPWLFGAKIYVITDHNPLTFLATSVPQNPRLQRWALAIQRFDITIQYRRGAAHTNADALSRLPNSTWK